MEAGLEIVAGLTETTRDCRYVRLSSARSMVRYKAHRDGTSPEELTIVILVSYRKGTTFSPACRTIILSFASAMKKIKLVITFVTSNELLDSTKLVSTVRRN